MTTIHQSAIWNVMQKSMWCLVNYFNYSISQCDYSANQAVCVGAVIHSLPPLGLALTCGYKDGLMMTFSMNDDGKQEILLQRKIADLEMTALIITS